MRRKKLRIFLGMIEIAGHYRELTKGFEALGHRADFVDCFGNSNDYSKPSPKGFLPKMLAWCAKKRQSTQNSFWQKFWLLAAKPLKYSLFPFALFRYDIFIFGHNTSFIQSLELPILKFFGKKIVFQFHGTDGRPRYMDGFYLRCNPEPNLPWLLHQTQKQQKLIARIDRWADIVINIGPQGHFHRRPYLQWLRMGLPSKPSQAPDKITQPEAQSTGKAVRILHCPSSLAGKGTMTIRKLMEKLKATRNIEYVEITGQPNAVVQKELAKCDFVIDQLYADYAMAGFATEAAWFGKPTIVAGWAVDYWKQTLPEHQIPPSHYCYPHELYDGLCKLVDDYEYRTNLGQKARAFVESNWAPADIAQRILDALDGKLDDTWYEDPQNIDYIAGWGMPQEHIRAIIVNFVKQFGLSALGVNDHPKLLQTYKSLINSEPLANTTGMQSHTGEN